MALGELAEIMKWLLGGWLLFVILLVLFRMFSGEIAVLGLLRPEKHAPFGIDRLQLLAVTLAFAIGYMIASLYKGPGDALPRIPTPLLLVLIGSNGTYLAVKFAALKSRIGRGS
jgi:hypothetical protein